MATWNHVHRTAPDLAERGRAVFESTVNAVLATVRADGSPRVSGLDPFFAGGELVFGSMPDSRKLADLRRDSRLAIHGIPWESRRLAEGADDPGSVDAKVTGRALALEPERRAAMAESFAAERGFEMPDGDLFRVDVDSLVLTWVEGEELVVDRWTEAGGRATTRRT
jgi:hypothetical protein